MPNLEEIRSILVISPLTYVPSRVLVRLPYPYSSLTGFNQEIGSTGRTNLPSLPG